MPKSNFSWSVMDTRWNIDSWCFPHHAQPLQPTPPPSKNGRLCSFSTPGSRCTRCACDYFLLIQFTDLNRTYMTKRETSLFVVYLHPLPRSKRETEGVVSLSTHHHHHHHHPSLARNARQRGWFLCRHTTTITITPSLARNARWRG